MKPVSVTTADDIVTVTLPSELPNVDKGQQVIRLLTLTHGWQIWVQSWSVWPQLGQIRDFFRSDLTTFWHFYKMLSSLI